MEAQHLGLLIAICYIKVPVAIIATFDHFQDAFVGVAR